MPAQKSGKARREADLAKTTELYLKGWLQREIASEMGISQQAVSNRIAKAVDRWRNATIDNIDALKAKELEKLDLLEREYWQSWQLSLGDYEETTDTTGTDLIGDPIDKHVVRRHGQTGNPTYLEGIRKCIEMRAKLLGMNARGDVDINIEMNQPIAIVKMDVGQL